MKIALVKQEGKSLMMCTFPTVDTLHKDAKVNAKTTSERKLELYHFAITHFNKIV